MGAQTVLDSVRVASPCRAAWSDMKGDDRVRHCSLCEKPVYNLSALSAADASALVERAEGAPCVRFYRRRDGTILTADCPVGSQAARRGLVRRLASCACVTLAVVAGASPRGAGRDGPGSRTSSPPPTGPGVTPGDWADWALEVLDIRRRQVVMGAPCTWPAPAPAPLPTPSGVAAEVPPP